ncbi:M23 family metallopeptidase [Roseivirga misakiensis]|uniref:Peptidase M23 n=1 Tax=Roseivirga misakiensis TaxID=1563681 RepID=A0A1E5T6E1_9BACT|nr:M23 family metallopeptidase [Roseivirga misakiensis]OEK06867.1 peptidase M23 [Roseivirga misakiensis]
MARFKKTLSNWLNARHIFIIQNEEDFSEKATYKFTYARIVFFAFLTFLVVLTISIYLVNTVMAQWFDPRYAEQETRKDLVQMSISLDSLTQELESRDRFITSFKKIMKGDVSTDEVTADQPVRQVSGTDTEQLERTDSIFKAEFEQGSDFLLTGEIQNDELRQLYFFSPITGTISESFDPQGGHFGVDIVSKKDEPVRSIADGTVIMASWTQSEGNVIAVQHRDDLISLYKHNATLIKEVGDYITAGEIVAIIGNTGELTSGPHLHFELWYNGSAVNPVEFISF